MTPRIIPFRGIFDERGPLHVCEHGDALPFVVKRFFMLRAEVREVKRGGFAHLRQSELLVSILGKTSVRVDGAGGPREFVLVSPNCGLYVPPMTWCEVSIARRSELLVLASDVYDKDDVMRDIPSWEDNRASA